jgi:hypothetical protein
VFGRRCDRSVRRVPLALLLLAACGPRGRPRQTPAVGGEVRLAEQDTTLPTAQVGDLVGRVAGSDVALAGRARASLGVCPSPRRLQLLASSESTDVLVSLDVPTDSEGVGAYAVAGPTDTTGVIRSARLGAQRLQAVDLAYRAVGGTVWLDHLGRVASGSLDVMLKEITTDRETRYLAVFERIPVDTLDAAACRLAAPDSTTRAQGHGPA